MPRTRRAGKKSKRRGRRGIIKLASGIGSRGVRDVGRGVGRVVGYVPIVGKPSRKVINVGSRMAGDAVTLVGNTTNKAAGIFTSPLRKLFGVKRRSRSRKKSRGKKRRSRTRGRKKSRGKKRRSRTRGRKKSRGKKRRSRTRGRKKSRGKKRRSRTRGRKKSRGKKRRSRSRKRRR
jgi:hypothetical protein